MKLFTMKFETLHTWCKTHVDKKCSYIAMTNIATITITILFISGWNEFIVVNINGVVRVCTAKHRPNQFSSVPNPLLLIICVNRL